MIQTLEAEGFLLRVPGADRVLLGPEFLRLAREGDAGMVLQEVARGPLEELSQMERETVTLSVVRADGQLDLIYQVDGPHHLVPRSWIGQRFALHASSSGKMLLSTYDEEQLAKFFRQPLAAMAPATITTERGLRRELARIRSQGYALTRDELEEGLSGVSVAIGGDRPVPLATINLSGLTQRLSTSRLRDAADRMRIVAGDIGHALEPNGVPSVDHDGDGSPPAEPRNAGKRSS